MINNNRYCKIVAAAAAVMLAVVPSTEARLRRGRRLAEVTADAGGSGCAVHVAYPQGEYILITGEQRDAASSSCEAAGCVFTRGDTAEDDTCTGTPQVECGVGCDECDTADTCTTCMANWVLDGGLCECPEGYALVNGDCTPPVGCGAGCNACTALISGRGQCTECLQGYHLVGSTGECAEGEGEPADTQTEMSAASPLEAVGVTTTAVLGVCLSMVV